jgi:hypothetical protein
VAHSKRPAHDDHDSVDPFAGAVVLDVLELLVVVPELPGVPLLHEAATSAIRTRSGATSRIFIGTW